MNRISKMRSPNFSYERKLWKRGFKLVAGTDEVGRGCFAGPVVTSAVVFGPNSNFQIPIFNEEGKKIRIDDSKKLTQKQRGVADVWIRQNIETYGIGEVSAVIINKIGMTKATQMAFRKAVINANRQSKKRIEYLLIDAFYIPYIRGIPIRKKAARKNSKLRDGKARQRAIVNGDEKVMSIAAASIIAKVYRDNLMKKIGSRKRYKKYDWENNKGYAAKKHQMAIIKYGTTSYHRKQFVDTFLKNRRNR